MPSASISMNIGLINKNLKGEAYKKAVYSAMSPEKQLNPPDEGRPGKVTKVNKKQRAAM
jgi:hypothetical protein